MLKLVAAKATAAEAEAPLSETDEALLLALKDLRLSLAQQRGVPAYVIFHDRTLVDMAHKKPADEAAFAAVFGIGEAKVRKFAQPFLSVIAEHTAGPESPPKN